MFGYVQLYFNFWHFFLAPAPLPSRDFALCQAAIVDNLFIMTSLVQERSTTIKSEDRYKKMEWLCRFGRGTEHVFIIIRKTTGRWLTAMADLVGGSRGVSRNHLGCNSPLLTSYAPQAQRRWWAKKGISRTHARFRSQINVHTFTLFFSYANTYILSFQSLESRSNVYVFERNWNKLV